jgi:hypothetical protein
MWNRRPADRRNRRWKHMSTTPSISTCACRRRHAAGSRSVRATPFSGLRPRPLTTTARTTHRRPLEKLPEDEQLLVRAAELVARGWCQKAPAADWRRRPVDPRSPTACSWSPLGALTRVWSERSGAEPDVFRTAWTAFALATGGRPKDWNAAQWRTRAHVLRAFERARRSLPQAREQIARRSSSPQSGDGPGESVGAAEPSSVN